MSYSDADFIIEPNPGDEYMGQRATGVAFSNLIATTPSLDCRPSEFFAIEVARTVYQCRVPKIIPYVALYILAAISRSCRCGCSTHGTLTRDYDDDIKEPPKVPSYVAHRCSEIIHGSLLSRVQKPHWGAYHYFVGSLLVASRVYPSPTSSIDRATLSKISDFSLTQLEELAINMFKCVDRDLRNVTEWMIKERCFRSIAEVQCPRVVLDRKRYAAVAAMVEAGQDDHPPRRSRLLKRWFSHRSTRGVSLSSCETEVEAVY